MQVKQGSGGLSDAALIARAQLDGDRQAFSELVLRHQAMVRAALRKLTRGNRERADDLAQETFLLAYRSLRNFRGDARFGTWLYRIAYNVFISDTRRRREEQLDEEAEAEIPAESQHTNLRIDLERAMRVLNEAEHAAIVQCYFNDLTHEEAAYVLGWPIGTVKTHILKAKQKLKAALQ